jgi:hypothetical protein
MDKKLSEHFTYSEFKKKEYMREYQKKNKEYLKEYGKQWRKNNLDKIKKKDSERWKKNKVKLKEQHKKWLKNHPDYPNEWYHKNIEKCRERSRQNQGYRNTYKKRKREINPQFKLDSNIGWMIWKGLKEKKNNKRWTEFVNYTVEKLMKHLEKQFTLEMNWNNYGSYWVVDHIIPRNAFKYTQPNDIDFQICWSLNNLRPLSEEENFKKGSRYGYLFK